MAWSNFWNVWKTVLGRTISEDISVSMMELSFFFDRKLIQPLKSFNQTEDVAQGRAHAFQVFPTSLPNLLNQEI